VPSKADEYPAYGPYVRVVRIGL